MKLYDFGPAVSAQRVRVFLAEKGLEVPTEQLNVRDGDQLAEPFTSMNPFHCVPFLELDDGKAEASVWLLNDDGIEPFDWNAVPPWRRR